MQIPFGNELGHRPRHRRILALTTVLVVGASCAAPRRQPLDDAQIADRVLNRATTVADIEVALALADLGPIVPRPSLPLSVDAADPQFWYACAFLYDPMVRQARRRVESRRAMARAAGRLQSIDARVEHVGAGDARDTEAMAAFDLLSVLGLGPSGAARALANAEVCDAFGELEAAVWSARFRVVRALIKRDAALERERAASALSVEAKEDELRLSTLESQGRGVPAEISWARATFEKVKQFQTQARIDAADAQAELAMASGLSPDHPALSERPVTSVAAAIPWIPISAMPSPARLLSTVPSLRALKLKYAVAEARVRRAAADTWPGVEIGPKTTFSPDDVLTGGILNVRLPLPGATQPLVCAAIIERTAAREALEDELVKVLATNRAVRRRLQELTANLQQSVIARRAAAEGMWRAARARFRSDEAALGGWNLALETWLDATLGTVTTRESIGLLFVDLEEISGFDSLTAVPAEPSSRPEEDVLR